MESGVAAMTPSSPEIIRAGRNRLDSRETPACWTVHLEFSIRADARRLFYALTVPEYIEAWMSFPGHDDGCSTVAAKLNQDYLVEHRCDGRPTVCIAGSYTVCQRHNLAFSWRVEGNPSVSESYVDIRLRGNFEKTTLVLHHSRLTSPDQCAWHTALWTASIGRLIALYEGPGY